MSRPIVDGESPSRGAPSLDRNVRCVYWSAGDPPGLVSHETHLSAEKAQASDGRTVSVRGCRRAPGGMTLKRRRDKGRKRLTV